MVKTLLPLLLLGTFIGGPALACGGVLNPCRDRAEQFRSDMQLHNQMMEEQRRETDRRVREDDAYWRNLRPVDD